MYYIRNFLYFDIPETKYNIWASWLLLTFYLYKIYTIFVVLLLVINPTTPPYLEYQPNLMRKLNGVKLKFAAYFDRHKISLGF